MPRGLLVGADIGDSLLAQAMNSPAVCPLLYLLLSQVVGTGLRGALPCGRGCKPLGAALHSAN